MSRPNKAGGLSDSAKLSAAMEDAVSDLKKHGPADRRSRVEDRHSPVVQVMGDRLIALCLCGHVLGGNRAQDVRQISLHDLIRLAVKHQHELTDNRQR